MENNESMRILVATDPGQDWNDSAGGDNRAGACLARRIRIGFTEYHVKLISSDHGEPRFGVLSELVADCLLAALGVSGRPDAAIVRFSPGAFVPLRELGAVGPIAYGRILLPAREEWGAKIRWPEPKVRDRDVVAQEAVLRWIGAGADHFDKGFLEFDLLPDSDRLWRGIADRHVGSGHGNRGSGASPAFGIRPRG